MKWEKTIFGMQLVFDMPKNCDTVVVCEDTSKGHKPLMIRLPHQIYKKDLERILESASSVTLIPYKNENKIELKSIKDIKQDD